MHLKMEFRIRNFFLRKLILNIKKINTSLTQTLSRDKEGTSKVEENEIIDR